MPNIANYTNYLSHALIEPPHYQRRFEQDLSSTASTEWVQIAKRAALCALPLFSLYKPCGQILSVGMGGVRVITQLYEAVRTGYNGQLLSCALQMGRMVVSTAALAGTVLNFQVGQLIAMLIEITQGIICGVQHAWDGRYAQAFEELVQILSSALYLSIMMTGSLEAILLSMLVQGVINFYQTYGEWRQGRWPEVISKFVMGSVRMYQAYGYVDVIHRRNFFLSLEKFAKLAKHIEKGREAGHLIDSPMHERSREVVLVDAEGKPFNFGAHFHGSGKGTVKGMNVEFQTKEIGGKTLSVLDFKVNHVFRERLQQLLTEMQNFNPQELREFLALTHSHATDIHLERVPFELSQQTGKMIGEAWKVTFEGLGSVSIGASPEYPNLYDRVRVEIGEERSLYALHELLSFFNLDEALRLSSSEDIERLKIGHLFRIFYPAEASVLERDEQFFALSVAELKDKIVQLAPEMEERFTTYLPRMEAREILPGRMRYSVPGLAEEVYQLGGRALITTITGASGTAAYDRVVSILKMGMLSSETRYAHDMTVIGLSPSADFYTGGADSVFTQFLTEKEFNEQMSLSKLYWGNIRVLFSLKVLETGTYQYHYDAFGSRKVDWGWSDYLHRPGILDFTAQEQLDGFHHGHEVMIKERIPPSMITGFIVPSYSIRDALLGRLRYRGITRIEQGIETILGVPVDRFIHISSHLSEEMLYA